MYRVHKLQICLGRGRGGGGGGGGGGVRVTGSSLSFGTGCGIRVEGCSLRRIVLSVLRLLTSTVDEKAFEAIQWPHSTYSTLH